MYTPVPAGAVLTLLQTLDRKVAGWWVLKNNLLVPAVYGVYRTQRKAAGIAFRLGLDAYPFIFGPDRATADAWLRRVAF